MFDDQINVEDYFLPADLIEGAILRDKEYAWQPDAFPRALRRAPDFGYACLGGQFWFLLADGSLYEPFWLEANSSERGLNEAWLQYALRSCEEVLTKFNIHVQSTAFDQEAAKFRSLTTSLRIMFCASFVTEQELSALRLWSLKSR